jgi:hypothetical protein
MAVFLCLVSIMLSVTHRTFLLSVVMLNVVMLSVVAPRSHITMKNIFVNRSRNVHKNFNDFRVLQKNKLSKKLPFLILKRHSLFERILVEKSFFLKDCKIVISLLSCLKGLLWQSLMLCKRMEQSYSC